MSSNNYIGFYKVLKDALVAARGKSTQSLNQKQIDALEKKLETAILTQNELVEIQKRLKELKKSVKPL